MSRPRYTWRASAETTLMGSSAADAATTAVLPTPVGPTMTGTSGGAPRSASPKSPLQLPARQLHHGGSAVHVVGRERRAEQPEHELPHLLQLEPLARLDGRATGERRREALQPVGERAEPPAREIGDELLEAARGVESGVGVGSGVHDHAPTRARLKVAGLTA